MEILFIAIALTILLALAPVRTRSAAPLSGPPPICRYVDIEEVRNPSPHWPAAEGDPPAGAAQPLITATARRMPTIEEDFVEAVACEGKKLIISTCGDVLLVRVEGS
ncbi:MAG TPA: hypothetical protein V6D08_16965 [Candidatus Obscuribacterales bacterium]